MIAATLVLLVAAIVAVAGAIAELAQALRRPSADLSPDQALAAIVAETDPAPHLAWLGLAALAVLTPGLLGQPTLPAADLARRRPCCAVTVLILGLAGERAAYLARLLPHARTRVVWSAIAAASTVLGGLVAAS